MRTTQQEKSSKRTSQQTCTNTIQKLVPNSSHKSENTTTSSTPQVKHCDKQINNSTHTRGISNEPAHTESLAPQTHVLSTHIDVITLSPPSSTMESVEKGGAVNNSQGKIPYYTETKTLNAENNYNEINTDKLLVTPLSDITVKETFKDKLIPILHVSPDKILVQSNETNMHSDETCHPTNLEISSIRTTQHPIKKLAASSPPPPHSLPGLKQLEKRMVGLPCRIW